MDGLKTVLEQVTGLHTRFVSVECPKHGRYMAAVGVGIDEKLIVGKCPTCLEEERKVFEEQARTEYQDYLAQKAKQEREAALRNKLLEAGLPEEYLKCSFSNFNSFGRQDVYDVIQAFRQVCDNSTCNLTVIGPTGQGKTHLAAATLRHIAMNDPQGKTSLCYIRESKMLRMMKAGFSNKNYTGPSEQEIIDKLSSVDVLVIDEIGKSLESQYNAQALEEIMDARYQKRRTIILGNVDADDLVKHFTDGTRSRLTWKAEKKELNIGEDYRRRLELEG